MTSWLEHLIKARFPDQRTSIVMTPDDHVKVSVVYSDFDLALVDLRNGEGVRALLRPLEPQPRGRRRRLHWGRRR